MPATSLYPHILAVFLFAVFSYTLTSLHLSVVTPTSDTIPEEKGPDEANEVRLNIVVPDTNIVTVSQRRHRIAANTDPGTRAYINEEEVKVFPSGAFVGMVDLPVGESRSVIKVLTEGGEVRKKTLHFYRMEPLKTTPADSLVIERDMMKPERLKKLGKGDVLEVQFKGSTGHQAFFSINGIVEKKPMQEQTLWQTGGIGGVYEGTYTVREDDHAENVRITFHLRDDMGNFKTAESPRPVSITPEHFPQVAVIQLERSFLYAEPDGDRLGGNRLGTLEKGVYVTITGRTGARYRIRLSDHLDGYLPVQSVSFLSGSTPLPYSSAGSVSVIGSHNSDLVLLTLGQRLPYTIRKRTNPNILEVDIYGAEARTHLIAHHENAEGIRRVDREEIGSGHYRLSIYLEHEMHWGVHVGYGIGSSLRIEVRRPPVLASAERPLEGIDIALDVGHGGNNWGALGSTGTKEKDVVLDIALKVRDRLKEQGANVIMTRDRDIDVTLLERSNMVLSSNARVLVSIHANSIGLATNPVVIQGTASYYRHAAFRPFAGMIHNRMLELPLENFGLIGNFNFALNTFSELPNVLVETAFMSHPEDEIKLLDPGFQELIAEKLIQGLYDFFLEHGKLPDYAS